MDCEVDRTKVVIRINGFYFPCPTLKQKALTKDLIVHVGQKFRPGFSVNMISPRTSVHQHCGFTSTIEKEGSPSIVLCVKLHHGVAPNYEQIQSLHEKIVYLTIDYYESTKDIVPSNQVWGKHFISSLTPYHSHADPGGVLSTYIHAKIASEEVVPTDGGGWQCNKNCCILPENMRSSYLHCEKSTHDKRHNTPGIWTESPHIGGDQKYYCSKCPGTREIEMMDFVTTPRISHLAVGAPFHSCTISKMKRHLEISGIPRKKYKVSDATLTRRSELALRDIPFAHPPPQCSLYGTPYLPSRSVRCYRLTCPLLLSKYKSHGWSICSDFD